MLELVELLGMIQTRKMLVLLESLLLVPLVPILGAQTKFVSLRVLQLQFVNFIMQLKNGMALLTWLITLGSKPITLLCL